MVDGQDIYAPDVDPVLLRRRVGMVFQRPNPFPLSILANVTWGLRGHGLSRKEQRERAEESLMKAGLWDEVKDRLKDPALRLSGGQQQRLCIARALAVRPDILLMDEPTSALDPRASAKIEELMMELKKEYTVVLVSHNMHQARRGCRTSARFSFTAKSSSTARRRKCLKTRRTKGRATTCQGGSRNPQPPCPLISGTRLSICRPMCLTTRPATPSPSPIDNFAESVHWRKEMRASLANVPRNTILGQYNTSSQQTGSAKHCFSGSDGRACTAATPPTDRSLY